MALKANQVLYSFNRGVVSPLGVARLDVKRASLAAQEQTNWIPRALGPMALRVGWEHLGSMASNAAARMLRFIFATDDTALLEFTDSAMRVWIDDELLTRSAVTTAVTNGNFDVDLSGWTDNDEAGAVSQWFTGGFMELLGTGTSYAIREQQVTVSGADAGVEHALRIVINVGPVVLRVGSTSGDDDYVGETALGTGTHSLSFTPTGDFFIQFKNRLGYAVFVDSCNVEAAGVVTLPTPYGPSELDLLRSEQSADVIWLACPDHQQRKIERRGTRPNARSWSIVQYQPEDGPFRTLNTTVTSITPSAITGNITLTASAPLFKSGQVGALFSLTSTGQTVTATGAANGVFTSSIRVTGIGTDRAFSIVISGDASASTVDLQRSFDDATWASLGAPNQWTADVTTSFNDGLDNQIVFYRLILTTRVAPDSVTMRLSIGTGSVRGVVRITNVNNSTTAAADVLADLGGVEPTLDWQEGMWSDLAGWPSAVAIHEGRLWWFGINGIWGSISDAYDLFDETLLGNAAPINRTIGSGPVDNINWGISLRGLVLGGQGAEMSVRASSLDEAITPTNFNVKTPSTQGSSAVTAVKVDQAVYFVDRTGTNVYELGFDAGAYDISADNLMELYPGLGAPEIVRMDVQRKPDTRIHAVRSDGTVVVGVMNRKEDVLAWIPVQTNGAVEDVVVLPALAGDKDDRVYYVVRRTIDGATVRYLEKWAQEDDCLGGTLNLQADAFKAYSGVAITNFPVGYLSHLEGEEVVVWADGADVGTDDSTRPWTQRHTIANGQLSPALSTAASNIVVGLGYSGRFKSMKLGLSLQGGSFFGRHKNIDHLALVLANYHPKGLRFGTTFDETGSLAMDDMPAIEEGTAAPTTVQESSDGDAIEFPGTWQTDSRLCLLATAPRPVTVLAAAVDMGQN